MNFSPSLLCVLLSMKFYALKFFLNTKPNKYIAFLHQLQSSHSLVFQSIMILMLFLTISLLLNNVRTEETSTYKAIRNLFMKCSNQVEVVKCFKIQALKIFNRASYLKNIQILDGIRFVRNDNQSRYIQNGLNLNDTKLQRLDSNELDDLLGQTSIR